MLVTTIMCFSPVLLALDTMIMVAVRVYSDPKGVADGCVAAELSPHLK